MGLNGNPGYGKILAKAAKNAVDDPDFQPARFTSWLDTWFDPVKARNHFRRLLRDYLVVAMGKIPVEATIKYLEEMIVDLRQLDQGQAVDRFVDKVVPKLLLNDSKQESSDTG